MTLAAALSLHRRVELTRRPTPLQRLEHLSAELGLDIWLKRDDLSDLALGGDKPRKLEFELALAIDAGADTIVTCGSSQSNMARLTAAAARKLGLDCSLVLSRDDHTAMTSNLLTVKLMGVDVRLVDVDDHWDLEQHASDLCDELRSKGRSPHFVPVSGTTPTSCLGYVDAGLEMLDQAESAGIEFDTVYTPVGTGGIFTGTLLAFRHAAMAAEFRGISVNRDRQTCESNVDHWWKEVSDLLGLDPNIDRGRYQLDDSEVGPEYGVATNACLDAIIDLATTEGILLDPVYSGKMFAAFYEAARQRTLPGGSSVLLVHSGGVPALFAYATELEQRLATRRN